MARGARQPPIAGIAEIARNRRNRKRGMTGLQVESGGFSSRSEQKQAPRVRGKKYCHMHLMMEEARPEKISLPNLADAAGIHGAIAKGAQAVVDGKLDYKQASILGYYLQLALSNVGKVEVEEPVAADSR